MAKFEPFNSGTLNYDYRILTDIKIQAIKAALHKWGFVIRAALKEETNLETSSRLYKSLHFKVEPERVRDIKGQVSLIAGIIEPNSPVLKYLKFFVHGNTKHFVPVTYRGRSTGILQWARNKGLVHRKGNVWVWSKGEQEGKRFKGIPNAGNNKNNFFERVYARYDNQIKRNVMEILQEVGAAAK